MTSNGNALRFALAKNRLRNLLLKALHGICTVNVRNLQNLLPFSQDVFVQYRCKSLKNKDFTTLKKSLLACCTLLVGSPFTVFAVSTKGMHFTGRSDRLTLVLANSFPLRAFY